MKRRDAKYYLCIMACCVLLLMPYMVIAFYARPAGDDFSYSRRVYAALVNNGSVLDLLAAACRTVKAFYLTWQGTYTSAFVMSFQPGLWGHRFYFITPYVFMISAFAGIFAAVRFINKRFVGKSNLYAAAISMMLTTVLLLWMPSPNQGMFWFNGAMHYVPWFFASIANITMIADAETTKSSRRKWTLLIGSSVLSFLISGANQITAFMNILLMFIALLVTMKRKRAEVLIPLAAAVVGFVIMFVAPGNAIRQESFNRQGVLQTMAASLKYAIMLIGAGSSLQLLLSLVLITPFAIDIAKGNRTVISKWTLLFSFAASFAVFCGMLCVIYMPTGGFGAPRVANVVWFAFMLLVWFNYCLLWMYAISHGILKARFPKRPVQSLMIAILCLMALFIGRYGENRSGGYVAFQDLYRGRAQQYAKEHDQRFELYYDDSVKEVAVKAISVRPKTLACRELSTSPDGWPNTAVTQYFGKDKIYRIPE